MPLPKVGTKGWAKEKEFYRKSTHEQRVKRAKEFGYTNVNAYTTMMNRKGAHLEDKELPEINESSSLSTEENAILKIINASKVPVY